METGIKRTLLIAGAALFIVAAIIGFKIYTGIKMSHFTPPPTTVTSAAAALQEWQDTFDGVGSLAPVNGTSLSAEESGKVARINFDSGSRVESGAVLVELDTSVEEANLKGARAMKLRMQKAFERADTLHAKNAISNDEFDNISAQFQQSDAQVAALEATIRRKKIVAPFSGIAGIRTVNVGQYVAQGTPIVPLYAIEDLYVNFMVPQQFAGKLAAGQKLEIRAGAQSPNSLNAVVTAINPNVDEASRNLWVQGTLRNEGGGLRPGMFASVSVAVGNAERLLTLPITAIQYAPYGDSVYVIEKKDGGPSTVRQQFVKVGSKRGDQISILSGLKEGEEVVTSGLFKLRPGAAVVVNNTLAPSANPNPSPQDT